MNRDIAMAVLANEPLGSFMVRRSETQPGSLALSVRVPSTFHPLGITHYIIVKVEGGHQIKVGHRILGTVCNCLESKYFILPLTPKMEFQFSNTMLLPPVDTYNKFSSKGSSERSIM